ncbi:MAG TPA: hypothetical protein H9785_00300 [Candidatus Bacteroides intestinavium]|uniref:Group II intron maturase-specific domain-containing protein n=1 Tax=Candidatus Bacteroides intestinavium TaxID=2838469 RepID=A0A9D2HNE4_9BACE|nr:hypothetical protein [Candidatus Bacteroides intestinavium]
MFKNYVSKAARLVKVAATFIGRVNIFYLCFWWSLLVRVGSPFCMFCMSKLHLTRYIQGWLTYYRYADMKTFIISANKWYNRRLRMYIWKSWKQVRTRFANLQRCGVPKWQAWKWANTRKGYWRVAQSVILTSTITSERLLSAGYPSILNLYIKLHRS